MEHVTYRLIHRRKFVQRVIVIQLFVLVRCLRIRVLNVFCVHATIPTLFLLPILNKLERESEWERRLILCHLYKSARERRLEETWREESNRRYGLLISPPDQFQRAGFLRNFLQRTSGRLYSRNWLKIFLTLVLFSVLFQLPTPIANISPHRNFIYY